MKFNLIDINTSLFSEFNEFKKSNEDWSVGSHLNFKYDIDAAILFSKLYFPDFILRKECVILNDRFDDDAFEDWYNEFKGDINKIEKMCNLYEVKDLFHINSENVNYDKINELGGILNKTWQVNLDILFPNRKMKVDTFLEEDDLFITFYSEI